MRALHSAVSGLALFPAAISAVTFDCGNIVAGGHKFDLSKLSGPKAVHWPQTHADYLVNTTFTVDVCQKLAREEAVPYDRQCSDNTRVCGIERDRRRDAGADEGWDVREVINIAGEYSLEHGGRRSLDAKVTRLKDGSSNADAEREGVRLELHGGYYQERYQKAVIEFVCDPKLEGTEGFEEHATEMVAAAAGEDDKAVRRREDAGDGKEGGDQDEDLPNMDEGKAMQFKSYKVEDGRGVLRLEWKTKHACERDSDGSDGDGKKAGWGFFTWFLIIVFLLAATYIIFGSWLNYNRYGARGWDLIPHGDTIRDLPYIVKDLGSGVVSKLKGSGTRGGYSAV